MGSRELPGRQRDNRNCIRMKEKGKSWWNAGAREEEARGSGGKGRHGE